MDRDEITHDFLVKYLSSVPEKKFKRVAYEINPCYLYITTTEKSNNNVNHRWSIQRKVR